MNILIQYEQIKRYAKNKNNLEKILNEMFDNKIAIYYFLYQKYKTPRLYRKLIKNLLNEINYTIENVDIINLKNIYKLVGEKLFKASIFTLPKEEQEVILEFISSEEDIINYIVKKIYLLKEKEIRKYYYYLYILLLKNSFEFNKFENYILTKNTKIKYLKQLSKAISKYGEKNIEITNENLQMLLWKYANEENIDIIKSILMRYKKVNILESRFEHLKVHDYKNTKMNNEKSVFYGNPIEIIEKEFSQKTIFDVYYDTKKRNIVIYIKCDKCIGGNSQIVDMNVLKIILDNLGRIITAYPAFYKFKG